MLHKYIEMKYYRQKMKRKRRKRVTGLVSFLLLFFVALFFYFEFVICPIVIESTRQMISNLSTTAVSNAVYDVLSNEQTIYTDLVKIQFDDEDNVKLINLETVNLNKLARKFYVAAQDYLDKMGQNGINVSLGTFSGIPFLVGFGPKINLKLVSIGTITSNFESVFSTAGINQTNHSLFVKLYASVSLLLPVYKSTIDSVTEILVAESVIVGDVPQVYFAKEGSLTFCPT